MSIAPASTTGERGKVAAPASAINANGRHVTRGGVDGIADDRSCRPGVAFELTGPHWPVVVHE
jgi:hypothetical protein